jgi:hypothetical protein
MSQSHQRHFSPFDHTLVSVRRFSLAFPIEPNLADQDILSLSWFRAGLGDWHDRRTIDASNYQEAYCIPE